MKSLLSRHCGRMIQQICISRSLEHTVLGNAPTDRVVERSRTRSLAGYRDKKKKNRRRGEVVAKWQYSDSPQDTNQEGLEPTTTTRERTSAWCVGVCGRASDATLRLLRFARLHCALKARGKSKSVSHPEVIISQWHRIKSRSLLVN